MLGVNFFPHQNWVYPGSNDAAALGSSQGPVGPQQQEAALVPSITVDRDKGCPHRDPSILGTVSSEMLQALFPCLCSSLSFPIY